MFTEQGVAKPSSVPNCGRAVWVNIESMRACLRRRRGTDAGRSRDVIPFPRTRDNAEF
jgi:hypothetical protein